MLISGITAEENRITANTHYAYDDVALTLSDAPRAILTLAQFCEADGDKKKAIALYRRLLSQPEWKKTGESSQAHQALERLGERTGGAMINEVR